MMGGYVGRILRVNLTNGTSNEDTLPEDMLRKYIGGAGIGARLLYDERPFDLKPLDPDDFLIIMTGPLTGLPVPASCDWAVINFNTQTGKTIARAHGHGYFGAYLKFAGYDGIVIKGASKKPVYLWIHDGEVEIRDASKIWGRDSHETEDLIKEELGVKDASVAAIGQGGENLVSGALIQCDKHHHASKGDCGVMMGSKKLKAIAVYGNMGIPIADSKRLLEVGQGWREACFAPGAPAGMLYKAGVTRLYAFLAEHSMCAAKNYLSPDMGSQMAFAYVKACATGKLKITPNACFGCPIACAYKSEINYGPYKGKVATLSGGAEALESSASMVGITDPAEVQYITDLYDRLGLDAPVGLAMALAFECYEKGLLTKEKADGLELRWGDMDVILSLLDKVVKREGFGNVLADGPVRTAQWIGGDAPKYAIHIKGAGGLHIHDWRAGEWSVLLGLALAQAGPRFEGSGVDGLGAEPDLGYPERTPPEHLFEKEGKSKAIRQTAMHKVVGDSIGLCMFTFSSIPGIINTILPEALMAATGWEGFTRDEYLLTGERILNLERVFNVRCGLTPEDDLNVSPRLLEAPTEGKAKGIAMAPYLKDMVMEYYDLMGWDKKTGKPSRETLERVGLEDLIKDIY